MSQPPHQPYGTPTGGPPGWPAPPPRRRPTWVWVVGAVLAVLLVLVLVVAALNVARALTDDSDPQQGDPTTVASSDAEESTTADPRADPTDDPTGSGLTSVQAEAAERAVDYLNLDHFSRLQLISQLEYEGVSTEDATVAVDSLDTDWDGQAAAAAQSYLDFAGPLSREDLLNILLSDDFTQEQAEYGVAAVGL